ncbi:MAG: hypothetical protein KKA19_09855 [Candidatus Margulisbacteria bacterium]|nr:hypothetical protein [Candidatus Margulisiibacteriota bacterium]
MKSEIKCKKCNQVTNTIYSCDECGDKLQIPELVLFSDCVEYHFCSYKCLSKFSLNEMGKEPLDNRFIYGKE